MFQSIYLSANMITSNCSPIYMFLLVYLLMDLSIYLLSAYSLSNIFIYLKGKIFFSRSVQPGLLLWIIVIYRTVFLLQRGLNFVQIFLLMSVSFSVFHWWKNFFPSFYVICTNTNYECCMKINCLNNIFTVEKGELNLYQRWFRIYWT